MEISEWLGQAEGIDESIACNLINLLKSKTHFPFLGRIDLQFSKKTVKIS